MLVLERCKGEAIDIDKGIQIRISKLNATVALSIKAASSRMIFREEFVSWNKAKN